MVKTIELNFSKHDKNNSDDRGKSVRNAALDAANKITEYCPIRFRGNRSYDGFD